MNNYDPTDLESQKRDKAQLALKRSTTAKLEEDDIKWLMGMKRGRAIVWRQLEYAGVFRLSFNTNAMQMAFNEGGRNYGNRLLAQVNTLCPELYVKMQQEATTNDRDDGNGTNSN